MVHTTIDVETKRGYVADQFSLEDLLNDLGISIDEYQDVLNSDRPTEALVALFASKYQGSFDVKLQWLQEMLEADKKNIESKLDLLLDNEYYKKVKKLNKTCRTTKQKWILWSSVLLVSCVFWIKYVYPLAYAVRNGTAKINQDIASIERVMDGENPDLNKDFDGAKYASPLPTQTFQQLVDYKPSFGQSFGPETGNSRWYGPHGGIDFDCRVGGCAGAAVASPIAGKVTEIRKIATSVNGGSYQVHIQGDDWVGSVEHQLVHVDSISVKVGDTVSAGQIVAKVSPKDSVSTDPHFDWKILRLPDGWWQNPQKWVMGAIEQGGN